MTEPETNDEKIVRFTSLIKRNPNSSVNYYQRGNAYLNKGQVKPALTDFNKAIELNEKKALYYYVRGMLFLKYGNQRKALIDLDIATILDPDALLFLTGRADALQMNGKLDKALADCNKVLKKERKYKLALYVRRRVYKSMGKEALAKADEELIEEI